MGVKPILKAVPKGIEPSSSDRQSDIVAIGLRDLFIFLYKVKSTATENRTPILWMKTIGPNR